MLKTRYLIKGLRGLARAHQANGMTGHLGAAVVAGYLFAEAHQGLDTEVYVGIEQELDRIMRGEEALWFDPEKAGITIAELFAPLPDDRLSKPGVSAITQALASNIDQTRQSGHNVIFASLALRVLQTHSNFATAMIIDGICRLIAGFNDAGPGQGYYGQERGWIQGDQMPLSADDGDTPYDNVQAMAEVVIAELIRSSSVRRQGFGGLTHLINHATALVELSRLGHQDLAQRGLVAHRNHLRLWRSLPNLADELGRIKPATHDPCTAAYWTHGTLRRETAQLTHRIKTMFGFYTLNPLVADPLKRQQAEAAFLYLMG